MDSLTSPKSCECGCGQPAPISTTTNANLGYVKGEPRRFVSGHNAGSPQPKGPDSPHWRGGTARQAGYVRRYVPDHPHAVKGYVPEHRLVIEATLGRYLKREEQVHHINEKRSDNRPENLMLFPSASEHRRHHNELRAKKWKMLVEFWNAHHGPGESF